ncbi:MAG: TIGR02757 family protein [Flavobacteriaceae bacterium]|nr:TIGR02757 family protein [Flavobacteriaceae bacterium]
MSKNDLKGFLDYKVLEFNNPRFIDSDPIQVPHRFHKIEDIEIAGFLTATIAWGNRKSIINNSHKMMDLMHGEPYHFVINHEEDDFERFDSFVHRTFNSEDLKQFIRSLKHIYLEFGSLENVFVQYAKTDSLQFAIHKFKNHFFEVPHLKRTQKHISDPMKNSAAKRINMFLRWMIRNDQQGVDFGVWTKLSPSQLSCPLDVHSGKVARKLGLLNRKQNDAKAVLELDSALRELDPQDPVKYDFALFGLGVFEKF